MTQSESFFLTRLRRYGPLLLLGLLWLFALHELTWFTHQDGALTAADGHFTRLTRAWAWLQTGNEYFLLRWGEPLLDSSLIPYVVDRSPYPPLALAPYLPGMLLFGPSLETIRLIQVMLVGLLLGMSTLFSYRWSGTGGALISLSLLSGSPLVLLTARSPVNEPVAMAAAMACLICLLGVWERRQRGWGAGLLLGVALLIKWLVVPVLLLPLVLLTARGLTEHTRQPLLGMLGLLVLALMLCVVPLELGVIKPWVVYGLPALTLSWLVWSLHRWGQVTPEPLALALTRTLGMGLMLAFPWYFSAAESWRAHVVQHPGWETPVQVHLVPVITQVLAVALPMGGIFLLMGLLSLLYHKQFGRLALSVSMSIGLLVLLLFTGRPLNMLTGDLQGRLLLPAVVMLAIWAGEGARVPRLGTPLVGLALVLGLMCTLAPRLAPPLMPLRGMENALLLRHPDDGTVPPMMTLGWWWRGLAVVGPPRLGEPRPRTAQLLQALPLRQPPVLTALVDERLPGVGGEEDLTHLAATGRIVTLARGTFRRQPLAWLQARLPFVQEVVLLGPTSVQAGDYLVEQGMLRPLSRQRLGSDPLLVADVLPSPQTP
ncbi:MAG: glycosyltransferase family 39 protein [Myxococcota bacterium]